MQRSPRDLSGRSYELAGLSFRSVTASSVIWFSILKIRIRTRLSCFETASILHRNGSASAVLVVSFEARSQQKQSVELTKFSIGGASNFPSDFSSRMLAQSVYHCTHIVIGSIVHSAWGAQWQLNSLWEGWHVQKFAGLSLCLCSSGAMVDCVYELVRRAMYRTGRADHHTDEMSDGDPDPGIPLQSFDISWVNPKRAEMYFADRSNGGSRSSIQGA